MADNIKLPYRYISGLTKQQQHEIWRDFEAVAQQALGAASVYDAIVDPGIVASVPTRHLYINFTELIAGESSNPNHQLGFNIGVVPRAFAQINEPGGISFAGWSHVNIVSIAPAATEGVSAAHAPFWNIPVVGMATGQIISLSGIHIPSGTGGFFGFAGSNIVLMNECWVGSGITCSPGSLYATDSLIGSQKVTGGGTFDDVILHDCVWTGAVNFGGIHSFHMLGGYLNGSLTTTGNIGGGFIMECAIQGTVQLNHVEGGVVNNLGSQNGTFFSIGSAVTGKVIVTGAWDDVWLQGRGVRADVQLTAVSGNPALQLVGVTDSLITAAFRPTATASQAYTIDAASARNIIIASGLHNAFFTVASTNAGTNCLVIDELGVPLPPLADDNIWIGNGSSVATAHALTGDVTMSDTGVTAIGAAKVTKAMEVNIAANSLRGNNTGSAATGLDLTVAQVKTLLAYVVGDVSGAAPLASPALTGHPTGVTEAAGDNSTRLATTAYADAGGHRGLIAVTNYDPAGLVTFTLTTVSKTKLDTTNLVLAFVVPPSGNVLVEVNAVGRCSTSATGIGQVVYLQLVDHGTTTQRGNDSRLWDEQWNATAGFTAETVSVRGTCQFYLTGLTPGATITVDLAAYCLSTTSASANIFVGGGAGSIGAITMTATAAP